MALFKTPIPSYFITDDKMGHFKTLNLVLFYNNFYIVKNYAGEVRCKSYASRKTC